MWGKIKKMNLDVRVTYSALSLLPLSVMKDLQNTENHSHGAVCNTMV